MCVRCGAASSCGVFFIVSLFIICSSLELFFSHLMRQHNYNLISLNCHSFVDVFVMRCVFYFQNACAYLCDALVCAYTIISRLKSQLERKEEEKLMCEVLIAFYGRKLNGNSMENVATMSIAIKCCCVAAVACLLQRCHCINLSFTFFFSSLHLNYCCLI